MTTDYGLLFHFIMNDVIVGTVVYADGTLTDLADTTSPATPIDVALDNTKTANKFARDIKDLSSSYNNDGESIIRVDLEIRKIEAAGTIVLEEKIKGVASDTELDFQWTYDIAARTVVLIKKPYEISYAAFELHVQASLTFLILCSKLT